MFGQGGPSAIAPTAFYDLIQFGILPWWPASGPAKAYRALNSVSSITSVYETPQAEAMYNKYVTNVAVNQAADLINLVGQTPGAWTLPVCDQGANTWTYDWTGSGGLSYYRGALPCACGIHGSGTENFYQALTSDRTILELAFSQCEVNLLNVAPGLPLAKENIGWNAIVGGQDVDFSPKTIVYGASCTVTAPSTMPIGLYFIGDKNENLPNGVTQQDIGECEAHPNHCIT